MEKPNLPMHLQWQLQQGNGSSYRTALKFREEDAPNFARYEYQSADQVGTEKFGKRCRVIQQELVITKLNKVFDILTIATMTKPKSKSKIYFDITQVFGKLS